MPHFEQTATLASGRQRDFESNGVSADGGYDDTWVVIRAGRIPVAVFPNTRARSRSRNLYAEGYSDALLDESLEAARARLGIEFDAACGLA